jgi:hypothetical protein
MANPTILNSYHTVCGFRTMLGHSTMMEFGKPTGTCSFALAIPASLADGLRMESKLCWTYYRSKHVLSHES